MESIAIIIRDEMSLSFLTLYSDCTLESNALVLLDFTLTPSNETIFKVYA